MSEIRGDCLGYLGIYFAGGLESIWFRCPKCVSITMGGSIRHIPVYPFEGIEKFQLVCSDNCSPVNPDPRPCLYYRQDEGFTDEEMKLINTLFYTRSSFRQPQSPESVIMTESGPIDIFTRFNTVNEIRVPVLNTSGNIANYSYEVGYIDINGNRVPRTNNPSRTESEPDCPF